MDADRGEPGGRVPLAGLGKSYSAERPVAHRDGIRHARRLSNWTAAALIVGTGAAAVAFAHQALPAAAPAPATGTAAPGAGAPAAGVGASTPGTTAPQVSHSVATTSASGVTTTRTVNGKTLVIRTAPARGDD